MATPTHDNCIRVQVPPEACYVRFSDNPIARTDQIGTTGHGEMMIADYDSQGHIVGIELVGSGKPCQE